MSEPAAAGRKYIPRPEGLNLEFHHRSADGSLHLQRCDHCARYRHPPRYVCAHCSSARWTWTPVPGHGCVYSWVVTHLSVDRGWADEVPYTTVAVELDEGPRVLGAWRPTGATALRIGQPVTLVLEPKGEDFVFVWVEPT